jgi:ribonuclease D
MRRLSVRAQNQLSFRGELGFFNGVIDNEKRLMEFLPQVDAAEWVAIDTEADSLHAYPEKLCLLQISLPGSDDLIDTLAKLELGGLLAKLGRRELVLHGADYDLRLLHRTYGFVPRAIFDTMWAARLLGLKEFGLTSLVAQMLGVALEKGPQKMDWAKRPLTERMEAYARNDTKYLKALSDKLKMQLKEKGRLSWHKEVCARVIKECTQPKKEEPDQEWRVKGSDRLNPFGLAILKEIWQWREEEAIASNKPPYFIFSHELLVELAAGISRREYFPELVSNNVRGKRRERLFEAVHRGLAAPKSGYPKLRRGTPQHLNSSQQKRFETLKKRRDQQAVRLELDPSLIASRSLLFALARNGEGSSPDLMKWQRELLED